MESDVNSARKFVDGLEHLGLGVIQGSYQKTVFKRKPPSNETEHNDLKSKYARFDVKLGPYNFSHEKSNSQFNTSGTQGD